MTNALQNTIESYALSKGNLVDREGGLVLNDKTVKRLTGFILEELPQEIQRKANMQAKIALLLRNLRFRPKKSSPMKLARYHFSNEMIKAIEEGILSATES